MPDYENRCVFHGTAKRFDVFDEAKLGTGLDANSTLGFFFSDCPLDAAEYATTHAERDGGEARVLVVRTLTENPLQDMSYYDFFGFPDGEGEDKDQQHFIELRKKLIADGFDSIDYHDGEQDIFVVLESKRIETVAVLTTQEAFELNAQIGLLADGNDDAARFRIVDELLAARKPQAAFVP